MKSKTTGWIMTACVALTPVLCVEPIYGDTVHAAADTNINLATPGQVNGSNTSLFIRNSGAGGERHTFLRFDLSTLQPGISVSKATLRLWVSALNDDGPVEIHAVRSLWDEGTLSASTSPLLGPPIGSVSFSAASQDHFVTADITVLVQGWMNGTIEEFGIALVPTSADPVRITVDSKEATGTSHGPELEVTLIGPEGPQGLPGPTGPQGIQGPIGPQGPAGNLALAGQTCPQGQFVKGFDSSGDILCGPTAFVVSSDDLDFDRLPSAQGWLYFSDGSPEASIFSVSAGILTQNTVPGPFTLERYKRQGVLDPSFPFSVAIRVRVVADGGNCPTNPFGFAFGATAGEEIFNIGLSTTRIQDAGGVDLSTTIDNTIFHDYRLEVTPGVGYKLFVDGTLLGSGLPRSFPQPDPDNLGANELFFGDSTRCQGALAEVTSYTFTQGHPAA